MKPTLVLASLVVSLAVARSASAEADTRGSERVLLIVDGGGRAREAARVREAFVDHGFVRSDHVVLVPDATAETLARAVTLAGDLSSRYEARKVLLLSVVLGKKGTDRATPTDDLGPIYASLDAVPAIARVAFSDACGTGRRTLSIRRTKGVLHVDARGECAAPSMVDTWLTGLGGAADANDDHRLTVAEAFEHVREEACARGEAPNVSGMPREPAFDIILTHDASFADSAELVLPKSPGEGACRPRPPNAHPPLYRFFVYGEAAPFAEARLSDDREVRVRVPAGRIVVHVLRDEEARGLDLRLSAAEVRHLSLTEGRHFSAETLARDRGQLTDPLREMSVRYGGALGGYADVAHGGSLSYSYAHPTYAYSLVATAILAGTSTAENENLYTVFGARARVERRFFSGVPMVAIGAGLVGELALQSLRRKDPSPLAQTGYPIEERYRAGAVGPELFANLRTTVGGTSFFGVELAAVFPFAPVASSLQAFPRLEGCLYAGLAF